MSDQTRGDYALAWDAARRAWVIRATVGGALSFVTEDHATAERMFALLAPFEKSGKTAADAHPAYRKRVGLFRRLLLRTRGAAAKAKVAEGEARRHELTVHRAKLRIELAKVRQAELMTGGSTRMRKGRRVKVRQRVLGRRKSRLVLLAQRGERAQRRDEGGSDSRLIERFTERPDARAARVARLRPDQHVAAALQKLWALRTKAAERGEALTGKSMAKSHAGREALSAARAAGYEGRGPALDLTGLDQGATLWHRAGSRVHLRPSGRWAHRGADGQRTATGAGGASLAAHLARLHGGGAVTKAAASGALPLVERLRDEVASALGVRAAHVGIGQTRSGSRGETDIAGRITLDHEGRFEDLDDIRGVLAHELAQVHHGRMGRRLGPYADEVSGRLATRFGGTASRWREAVAVTRAPRSIGRLLREHAATVTKSVALDFDGVLATYDGWKGEDHFGLPMAGSRALVEALRDKGQEVVVFTARPPAKVTRWLTEHHFPEGLQVTNVKDSAMTVFLDDRVVHFYPQMLRTPEGVGRLAGALAGFRAHWQED